MLHRSHKTTLLAIMFCLGAITYIKDHTHILDNIQIHHELTIPDCNYPNHTVNIPTAHEQLKQELEQQEQLAWDLLRTNTKINKKECLEKQKKDYSHYKKIQIENQNYKRSHYPKLKEKTIHFVQDILQDFGLNSVNVQIVPYKGQGSPAAADDGTIFIDEQEFANFSVDACKFCIAHEIAHLQAQDESFYESICSLAKRKKTSQQKRKKALDTFRRFQEIRADMTALLQGGEKYARGAFDFFYKLQELDGGDNPGITHPKTSKRIEIAQNICSKMGWNVSSINA